MSLTTPPRASLEDLALCQFNHNLIKIDTSSASYPRCEHNKQFNNKINMNHTTAACNCLAVPFFS